MAGGVRMGFLSILSYAQSLIRERVKPGDLAIDATLGNGHDALFLCRQVAPHGHVYGFDVQAKAIEASAARLAAAGFDGARVTLLQRSHAEMASALPAEAAGRVAAVMFNLGYLPGGDHRLITQVTSTLAALSDSLRLVRVGGVVTVVLYPGHEGGHEEATAVEKWAAEVSQEHFHVISYRLLNQRNHPPYVIALECRKQLGSN